MWLCVIMHGSHFLSRICLAPMLKIAAATFPFGKNIRKSIRAVAATGATGVQFDARYELTTSELSSTGRRQLMHYLKEVGLSLASLQFPLRRAIYAQEKLDARLDIIRGAMTFAGLLNSTALTMHIGQLPEENSAEGKLLLEILQDLATHGNHVGTTLTLTPMGEEPSRLLDYLRRVKTGPLGVNFDPAAYSMSGINSSDAFRELHEFVTQVRGRDGVRDLAGQGVETEFGRGAVDWNELVALIEESRMPGWICVDRTAGEQRGDDIARAVRYLTTIGFS